MTIDEILTNIFMAMIAITCMLAATVCVYCVHGLLGLCVWGVILIGLTSYAVSLVIWG